MSGEDRLVGPGDEVRLGRAAKIAMLVAGLIGGALWYAAAEPIESIPAVTTTTTEP